MPEHTESKPAPSLSDFSTRPRAAAAEPLPSHPYDAEKYARDFRLDLASFVTMFNPTDRTLSARLFIGQPLGTPPFRLPSRRGRDDDDDDDMTAREKALAWAHNCNLWIRIEVAPGGQVLVPPSMIAALVDTDEHNEVIGGLMHELQIVGDPNPPTIHPSLLVDTDAQPFAIPTARRNAGCSK
ncbi:MAG TPA: hypothetical protein VFK05_19180 [Polyangiaceae bacterium]|nr:hypothetical protein [Polyangiaceae bacterium]